MREHEHRWCRETGSSALVCLECGSVWNHGAITPHDDVNREALAEFAAECGCSPQMSKWVNDMIAK